MVSRSLKSVKSVKTHPHHVSHARVSFVIGDRPPLGTVEGGDAGSLTLLISLTSAARTARGGGGANLWRIAPPRPAANSTYSAAIQTFRLEGISA